jgi:hypothetical protein
VKYPRQYTKDSKQKKKKKKHEEKVETLRKSILLPYSKASTAAAIGVELRIRTAMRIPSPFRAEASSVLHMEIQRSDYYTLKEFHSP